MPQSYIFSAFDRDMVEQTAPVPPQKLRPWNWLRHPLQTSQLVKALRNNPLPGETFGTRLAMYNALKAALSPQGQRHLEMQLKKGRLTDTRSDNRRSTLSHLFNMATTARAPGLSGKAVVEETLRILSEPQTITQRFGTLNQQSLQNLLQYYRSGYGPQLLVPIDVNTLRVASSATCVASSVMYYMALRCPSEFTRHIAELTSPRLAFSERADINEISPDNPSQAVQTLNDYGIKASPIPGGNGNSVHVKVGLPYSGLVRAINQQNTREPGTQGVVESAYQAALTHLVSVSYDPGFDMRVNPDGTLDPNKGLEEERKTLMESIIKDNGGVMGVTYQFTAAGRDGEPYLMGYFRSFDKVTQDLIQALDMGEDVLIGIVDTDRAGTAGRLDMKHELTLTGYEKDKMTGEIMFTIADSDDDNPNYVKRTARELVPMIHHAGFPVRLAQKINREMNQLNSQYMLPDSQDAAKYQLITTVPPRMQQAFLEDYQRMLQEQEYMDRMQSQQNGYPGYPNYPMTYPAQNTFSYYSYPGLYYPQQAASYPATTISWPTGYSYHTA